MKMMRVGSRASCPVCNYSIPQLVVCQTKGFGKTKKPQAKKASRVQEQQQQQETVQSPQAEPELSNIPTFLSEDTDRLDEEEVPEEISNRILSRILVFAGLPTFLGMLSLPLFYYLKVKQHWEIPTWGVYISSFLTFGIGVLGISYGAISASWTQQEGSALGVEEFKKNLPFALDKMRGK